MGILNVTPDSFAERPGTLDTGAAVDAALRMEADGADLIDIGGESTRPGADPVSAADEARARRSRCIAGAGTAPAHSDLDRYLQRPMSPRAAVDAAPPSSTMSAACATMQRWRVRWPTRGAALVLMHRRGRSERHVCARREYDDVVDGGDDGACGEHSMRHCRGSRRAIG